MWHGRCTIRGKEQFMDVLRLTVSAVSTTGIRQPVETVANRGRG
jgi:hypothetical protein